MEKILKKIAFALNIEHAALSMVEYYTHRGNISFFTILNFEEPPILYPLSMHDTPLRKTFQAFTVKFRDTGKKTS